MGSDQERTPLLRGRGVLLIEDFCRSTGLDQVTVENLMRTGRLEGALWTNTEPARPFGIFDDVLPSPEALAGMGLPVRDDYEPDALRSFELSSDDDPDADSAQGMH
jgi:hypothetical protein